MSMEFENMVRCLNCKKEFHENEVIYDGDEDMEFCPYCGEGNCIKDLPKGKRKYAIRVEEIIGRTIIVEAENLDDAIEKVENAANNDTILLDGIEDFVGREVKPSDVFEGGIVPEDRDVSFYEHLRVAK